MLENGNHKLDDNLELDLVDQVVAVEGTVELVVPPMVDTVAMMMHQEVAVAVEDTAEVVVPLVIDLVARMMHQEVALEDTAEVVAYEEVCARNDHLTKFALCYSDNLIIAPLALTFCMGGAYPVYYNYDIIVHHLDC